MKFKGLLGVIGLSLASGISIFAGVSVSNKNNVSNIQQVEAYESIQGYDAYFVVDEIGAFFQDSTFLLKGLFSDGTTSVMVNGFGNSSWAENSHPIYGLPTPEYTGSNSGWTTLKVLRYNSSYVSDTTYNSSHVWNYSDTITLASNKNKIYAYGWRSGTSYIETSYSGTYTSGHYVCSGDRMYFDLTWNATSEGYAVYFFDARHTVSAWAKMSKQVLGFSSNTSYALWEFDVPGTNLAFTKCIAVQLNNAGDAASWGNKKYQSNDVIFSNDHNVIKPDGTMDYSLSDTTRAEYYSTYFLSQTSVCDKDGITNNITNTIWSNVSNEYSAMISGAQTEFTNSSYSETGTTIQKAAARYDYILSKYGTKTYSNFANRTVRALNSSAVLPIVRDSDTTTILVVVAASALIAIPLFYGFISYKKRLAR